MEQDTQQRGRYLLYLDILGFKELLKTRSPKEVYNIIDNALRQCDLWKGSNLNFKTLYFSDSLVLYQDQTNMKLDTFIRLCITSSLLYTSLLANGIPTRGAISFGQFIVQKDTSGEKDIFFGNALVEAYEAEKNENWIGIIFCPSAWKQVGNIEIEDQQDISWRGIISKSKEYWKKREDDFLLLNPWKPISDRFEKRADNDDEKDLFFHICVNAFRFIYQTANKFAIKGDFSGPIAVKYHATLAFIRDMLSQECYEWVLGIKENTSQVKIQTHKGDIVIGSKTPFE